MTTRNIRVNGDLTQDGNTALHVAALHDEAGHVADLMMCNIDYHLKNNVSF